MNLEGSEILPTLGFVAAGSLLWLEYWYVKDHRRPEPRSRLVLAFLAGMASAGVALGLYAAAGALGAPANPGSSRGAIAAYCFGVVGPVEEIAKFLVARAIVFRWKVFDERVDGFVYASAVALGFAAVENFLYLPHMMLTDQIVRTLCAPLVHTLFAASWGYGTAHALLEVPTRAGRWAWQAGTVGLAAAVHGAYDFALYAGASALAVAGIVLVLWVSVIGAANHALDRDEDTEA